MQPLFSLDKPVSLLAQPHVPDALLYRDGRIEGLRDGGAITPVLTVSSTATLHEAYRMIQDWRGPLPHLLLVGEDQQPTGLVRSPLLLQAVADVCRNQGALLETLLQIMSEATTIVDKSNIVMFWNEAAEKIYELSREEVVGTPLDTYFARDSIRLKDALEHGTSVQRVYHVPRPDRHMLINSAPIVLDGEIIGALSIEQDITELVKLNEELADTTAHLHTLKQEMSRFQGADDPFFAIKGHSASIQAAIQAARKVAQTDATVLLHGESGVGKELFAQAIHQASRRHEKPFIAINCAAIPAALFESELFGYQGGAFTGAERKGKPGKLEMAHGGTLFLDEVGELPLELQAKLLRALQERQFYRVGGTDPITVNTRIIAATNRHLEEMIKAGEFREDLYYRLNVFSLEIPPLRERKEDILELVQIFLQEYSVTNGQPVPRITPEVMQALFEYAWPGNIRQLRNVMERLCILQEGGVIQLEHLPSSMRATANATLAELPAPFPANRPSAAEAMPLRSVPGLADERARIIAALERTYGNKKAAALLLGISRGTLYNKMKRYGIADVR